MIPPRRIVVFGGTSDIARGCLRIWSRHPVDAVLVGRDEARLHAAARDVLSWNPASSVSVVLGDLSTGPGIEQTVRDAFLPGPPDVVMVAVGSLPQQQEVVSDAARILQELTVNGSSPAVLCELSCQRLREQPGGHLVVLGSLAGERGRRSNYVYGAGKALLDTYVEGLRHSLVGTAVRVTFVKPGPTATRMTAGHDGRARRAPVDAVARAIVDAVERNRPLAYVPRKWRIVSAALRAAPRPLYDRLDI